jgi:anthraniloyl-CoA monooxygenase
MKIRIIGGGPGGLYFAQLVKRAAPEHDVVVLERNRPEDVSGFGVVFSDQTLRDLKSEDEPTYQAMHDRCVHWDAIEVWHRDTVLRSGGHGFSAISRKRLLDMLQQGARDAGVELRFATNLIDIDEVGEFDLLVAADGINSLVRRTFADRFGATEDVGKTKFIWLGSTKRWDSFKFIFEENAHGAFAVHGYPVDEETSTFLVETDEESWHAAGLDRFVEQAREPGASDLASMQYLEELFRAHLDGQHLLGNNSKWLNFRTIRCQRWHDGNVVLLGDAAHTAHFSVGSGTKMAMEDAISLAHALQASASIEAALTTYEQERRPAVARIQLAAAPSLDWWENFRSHMRMDPEQFVFHFLTRTPQVAYENLRLRDPRLVRRIDAWWAQRHGIVAEAAPRPLPRAVAAPITIGGVRLSNRIVTMVPSPTDADYTDNEADVLPVAGLATAGVGLVLSAAVDAAERRDDEWMRRWRRAIRYVHETSDTKVGLTIAPPPASLFANSGDSGATLDAYRGVAALALEAGFDLLYLCLPLAGDAAAFAPQQRIVQAARLAWPDGHALGVGLLVLTADGAMDADNCVTAAESLRDCDCDLIALTVQPGGAPAAVEHDAWRVLSLSDRIRLETGLPTMITGRVSSDDDANTAVLAGRADLYCGRPQLASRA